MFLLTIKIFNGKPKFPKHKKLKESFEFIIKNQFKWSLNLLFVVCITWVPCSKNVLVKWKVIGPDFCHISWPFESHFQVSLVGASSHSGSQTMLAHQFELLLEEIIYFTTCKLFYNEWKILYITVAILLIPERRGMFM